jgi:RND family efflux transporter MFP subunit
LIFTRLSQRFAYFMDSWECVMLKSLVFSVFAFIAHTSSALAEAALKHMALDAAQQSALGIRVVAIQTARSEALLASATVVSPPGKDVTITAPYPGQLTQLWAGVGDNVKARQKLGQFTSPMAGDARRQWQEAQLDEQAAAAALRRDQAMFDEGIIPAVRLQMTRTKHLTAQTALASRLAELRSSGLHFDAGSSYATGALQAPIAGVLTTALTTLGQRVEAGVVLFKIADPSQLQLEIQLSADKAARLKVGDEVSLPTRQAKGKIIGVSQAVDASQAAKARASITVPGSLQIGEILSVSLHPSLPSSAQQKNTWSIPSRAISQWRDAPVIFVVTAKGFAAQPVTIRASNDETSLIEAPLSLGSKAALTGIASLRALLDQSE